MTVAIIIGTLIASIVVYRMITAKRKQDFAYMYARTFTHVYLHNAREWGCSIIAMSDNGRTYAEKTLEVVFGDEIDPSVIQSIVNLSYRERKVELDLLIINALARMIEMSKGGSLETITQGLINDKRDKVLRGSAKASDEQKRGHVSKEAQEIINQASSKWLANLTNTLYGTNIKPDSTSAEEVIESITDFDTGKKLSDIILKTLNESCAYQYSKYTFTELYAYAFFEFENSLGEKALLRSGRPVRLSFSASYDNAMMYEFKERDIQKHRKVLFERMNELRKILISGQDRSDMIDGLSFYLDQASLKEGYQFEGEPVMIGGDFMASVKGKQELFFFCQNLLMPLIFESSP